MNNSRDRFARFAVVAFALYVFCESSSSFLSDVQGMSKEQNTATVGLIWWWGPKEGAW